MQQDLHIHMVSSARIMFLCFLLAVVSTVGVWAQENQEPPPTEEGDRTVRRLGDSDTEEYHLDLAIPVPLISADGANMEFPLPDPDQDARLRIGPA